MSLIDKIRLYRCFQKKLKQLKTLDELLDAFMEAEQIPLAERAIKKETIMMQLKNMGLDKPNVDTQEFVKVLRKNKDKF